MPYAINITESGIDEMLKQNGTKIKTNPETTEKISENLIFVKILLPFNRTPIRTN